MTMTEKPHWLRIIPKYYRAKKFIYWITRKRVKFDIEDCRKNLDVVSKSLRTGKIGRIEGFNVLGDKNE